MKPRSLRYLVFWRALGRALIVAMLVVALVPAPSAIGAVPFGDKIGHAVGFIVLVLWYGQIYYRMDDRWRCVAGAVALGGLIELLQALVPYRSADLLDLAADAVGALLGLALLQTPLGGVLSRLDRPPRAA